MPRPGFPPNHAKHHQIAVRHLALLSLTAALALVSVLPAHAAPGETPPSNVPQFVHSAVLLGHEDSAKMIEVSVWLQLHNKAELDDLARDLYDPTSARYRHWLTAEEIAKKFAPTAAEAQAVETHLESKGLKLVRIGPNNFFVRLSGSVGNVESAFHVSLNNYQVGAKVVRANDSEPYLEGDAAPLVRHVAGLDTVEYTQDYMARSSTPRNGSGNTAANIESATDPVSNFFVSECFTGFRAVELTTAGTFPLAYYHGNNYTGADAGCGYTPPEIQTAYGLNALYKAGLDGTGQTIVLIEYCGSPTILNDANAFSAEFGLPLLTAANFKIIYPATSTCLPQTNVGINLDVEWAHAIAPGANIDLVIADDSAGGLQDTQEAELYAISNHLGNIISGSYGTPEHTVSLTELETENQILEMAAVSGISANFPTGSQGDGQSSLGPDVDSPASAPYATAIGGVTVALKSDNSIAWQMGWGQGLGMLAYDGRVNTYPVGTIFRGSGGGASHNFAKPPFQHALPGTFRLVPDISWLADSYTGGVVAYTQLGQDPPLIYRVFGGTNLACSMFSGLWAIANQAAKTPLGQAAPHLYSDYIGGLPQDAITDIVPYSDGANVNGELRTSATSTTIYHSWTLAGVPEGTIFYSAFYDVPENQPIFDLLIFGVDSTLTVTKGWDNVTGVGVPNPQALVAAFSDAAK